MAKKINQTIKTEVEAYDRSKIPAELFKEILIS